MMTPLVVICRCTRFSGAGPTNRTLSTTATPCSRLNQVASAIDLLSRCWTKFSDSSTAEGVAELVVSAPFAKRPNTNTTTAIRLLLINIAGQVAEPHVYGQAP